ncbi:MAG: DUF4363 family protein [Oscillospiraceae bacterium]|nr:DUF4363 family protein [Oscillospiraceae bacterium]
MKKGWLGIAILVGFLILGFLTSQWMDQAHLPGAQLLQEAAEVTLKGDLDAGVALAKQAESLWQSSRMGTAAVADHSPMEEIDNLFRELWVYAATEETPHFAATSAALSQKLQAMADAHRLSWQSLL